MRIGRPDAFSLSSPASAPLDSTQLYGSRAWQEQAWQAYDAVPENHSTTAFIAACLSRLRFRLAWLGDDDEPGPVWDEEGNVNPGISPAAAELGRKLVRTLRAERGGQARLLAKIGANLTQVGELYLVPREKAGRRYFDAYSVDEMRPQADGSYIRYSTPGRQAEVFGRDDTGKLPLVIRIHREHPRFSAWPDASTRSLLPTLELMDLLTQEMRSSTISRIMGPGILWVSEDADLPPDPNDPDREGLTAMIVSNGSTAIRDKSSAAASVPIVIRVPQNVVEKGVKETSFSQKDLNTIEKREAMLGVFARGAELPVEQVVGMSKANHWCVDEQTEILTADGWKTHDALAVGEDVLTLDHETGLSVWQPASAVNRFAAVDEPMLSIEGRYHSSLSTMNHRWPVLHNVGRGGHPERRTRTMTTSAELGSRDWFVTAAPSADVPVEPKYSDALVELVGWFWTEGAAHKQPGRRTPKVRIYQSHDANPTYVARIRRALTILYGSTYEGPMPSGRRTGRRKLTDEQVSSIRASSESDRILGERYGVTAAAIYRVRRIDRTVIDSVPRWREIDRGNGMTVFALSSAAAAPLIEAAPGRVVRSDFIRALTASQLELFIDTSIRADGCVMSGGTRILGQADPARLAGFELAAVLAGYSPHSYQQDTEGFTKHTQHLVTLREKAVFGPRTRHMTTSTYTGTVWCPTTANGTWLARRNGTVYFTGNSAWQIDETTSKVYIAPVMEIVNAIMTDAYLVPSMALAIKRDPGSQLPDEYAGFVIDYDDADLVIHPDRSASAGEAYGTARQPNFAISGQAYRDAKGFAESDAPDAEEIEERMAWAERLNARLSVGAPFDDGTGLPDENGPSDVQPGPPPMPKAGQNGQNGTAPNGTAPGVTASMLAAAVEVAAERAVDRLGARLRSSANAKMAASDLASIAGKPSRDIPLILGPAVTASLIPAEQQFVGEFAALERTVTRWANGSPRAPQIAQRSVYAAEALARALCETPEARVDARTFVDLMEP